MILIVIAGCQNSRLPTGILPTEHGNFTLRVSPSDSRIVLVEGSLEHKNHSPHSAQLVENGYGVLQYSLSPGSYALRIAKSGYQVTERVVEVPESSGSEGPATVDILVELEPEHVDSVVSPEDFSLRGDPDFSVSDLSAAEQLWYGRFWAAIENDTADPNPDDLALSDDLYGYARQLHTHVQTLLLVFRVTGDLRLLDEVDRLAELMRSRLKDEWRDTLDGTDGTKDGFLNWSFRYGNYEQFEGKDTHKTNEIKAHALVAQIAYALHENRDVPSPSGRNYGAHADFWTDYLVNHFEAKWRKREGISSGYPILLRPHTHTYVSGLKYHYLMYRLTGNELYLKEADRQASVLWDNEIKPVSTSSGQAYVWARSVLSEGGSGNYLHPTIYSRNVFIDSVDFWFEGFHNWANEGEMQRLARTLTKFVLDKEDATKGDDWFAQDIGGGTERAGIPSDSSWDRMTTEIYSMSPFTVIAAWDETTRLTEVGKEVLADLGETDVPRTVYIVGGVFLDEFLSSRLDLLK